MEEYHDGSFGFLRGWNFGCRCGVCRILGQEKSETPRTGE
jgi:hypothetical protein